MHIDFKEEELQDLVNTLIRENFQPYLTSVGGSGLGILSPYAEHRLAGSQGPHVAAVLGQVTPPDSPTPSEQISNGVENGTSDLELDPLRAHFVSAAGGELSQWATGLGRWLYV